MRRKKKQGGGLVELGDLLEGALKQLGAKGDYDQFRVERKCREALGEKFSKALTGVFLKGGDVRMEFNHSIWMNEVNFRKAEILEGLRKDLPDVGIKGLTLALARRSKTDRGFSS